MAETNIADVTVTPANGQTTDITSILNSVINSIGPVFEFQAEAFAIANEINEISPSLTAAKALGPTLEGAKAYMEATQSSNPTTVQEAPEIALETGAVSFLTGQALGALGDAAVELR